MPATLGYVIATPTELPGVRTSYYVKFEIGPI